MDAVERQLTPREEQIMVFVGKGLTNKEIGILLSISDLTVKKHLEHVCFKLQQPNRIKAFHAHVEMCNSVQQEREMAPAVL